MRRCLKSRHIIIRMRLLHADVCSDAIIILIQYFSRMRPLQAVGYAPREIYIYDRSMTADMEVRQYMSKEDEIFKSVFSYIGDNLTEKLTVEEIAKHVYLSPTYLQSVFKEIMEFLWRSMSDDRSSKKPENCCTIRRKGSAISHMIVALSMNRLLSVPSNGSLG